MAVVPGRRAAKFRQVFHRPENKAYNVESYNWKFCDVVSSQSIEARSATLNVCTNLKCETTLDSRITNILQFIVILCRNTDILCYVCDYQV